MPTTQTEDPLPAAARDPFRASLRRSRERRAAAFRARRRRLRGRGGAAVLLASLTVFTAGAVAAPAPTGERVAPAVSADTVRAVQQALGIAVDGIYGPQTTAAVKRFQRANGLTVDGIAGPQTLAALGIAGSRASAARTTSTPKPTPPARTSTDAALLERIAECESGGDPTAVSADGRYRGKYQFSRATWRAMGGTGDPAAAPEEEQDRRAALLMRRQGPSAWPVCGSS